MSMNPEKASFVSLPENGEEFHQITDSPEKQYLISMLTRGSINAAQVVKKGDTYFSHQQKLGNLEENENSLINADADSFILEYVFGDRDHDFLPYYLKNPEWDQHGNIIINKTNSKHYLFDFGQALHPNEEKAFNVLTENGKEEFEDFIGSILPPKKGELSFWMSNKGATEADTVRNNKILSLLEEKTNNLLRNTFNDQKTFEALLEKSQLNLFEKDLNDYFQVFKEFDISTQKHRGEIVFKDLKTRLEIILKEIVDFNKSETLN